MDTEIVAAYQAELNHLDCGKGCIRFQHAVAQDNFQLKVAQLPGKTAQILTLTYFIMI